MEILRCENVTKTYSGAGRAVAALNGIDLLVEKGEYVAVTGASGSGKSTLLHIIGCVDRPTSGRVAVDGTEILTLSAASAAMFRRTRVGLVYQYYNLIPTLTVKENILLPLALEGRKPDMERLSRLAGQLGITELLEALPNELSGGQQQRAAVARALIYQPALLLLDEPTGNLDRKNAAELMNLVREANRDGGQTVLLVTHDAEIANGADRIVTLADGSIVSDRKREEYHA